MYNSECKPPPTTKRNSTMTIHESDQNDDVDNEIDDEGDLKIRKNHDKIATLRLAPPP